MYLIFAIFILLRISFIGHSLGGVIIRAALPYLEEFRDSMYTFLTLSTPHMGYLYNTSSLIDAGNKINKIKTFY